MDPPQKRKGRQLPSLLLSVLVESYGRRFSTGRSSSLLGGSVFSPSLDSFESLPSLLVVLASFVSLVSPSSRPEPVRRRRLGLLSCCSVGRRFSTSARCAFTLLNSE